MSAAKNSVHPLRCSQSGCTAPATWKRQSWVLRLPDQPVCDDHVKFYKACGLRCTAITPNDKDERSDE